MQVLEWYQCFKNGCMFLKNGKGCEYSSLSRNEDVTAEVHDLVRADQRLSFVEVGDELEHCFGSWLVILTRDLCVRCGSKGNSTAADLQWNIRNATCL